MIHDSMKKIFLQSLFFCTLIITVSYAEIVKELKILGNNRISAETIAVPMEVGTIQEAIDLAQGDDIVLVSPGRYNEAINFKGKAITVKSTQGAAVTTIDGWNLFDSVVKCISGEGPRSRGVYRVRRLPRWCIHLRVSLIA